MEHFDTAVKLTALPTVRIVGLLGCMDFCFVRTECPHADNPNNQAVKLRFLPVGCNTVDLHELETNGITLGQIKERLDDPELQASVIAYVLPGLVGKTHSWTVTGTVGGDFIIEAGYTRQPRIFFKHLETA